MLFLSTRGPALLLSAFPRVIDYRECYSRKCCKDTEKKEVPCPNTFRTRSERVTQAFLKAQVLCGAVCVQACGRVLHTPLGARISVSWLHWCPQVPRTEADASTIQMNRQTSLENLHLRSTLVKYTECALTRSHSS